MLLLISPFMAVSILPYVLNCSYVGCINIYNCYVFFLHWSLDHYVVFFLVPYNSLYFKVYFFLLRVLLLQLSFDFHMQGISFSIIHFSLHVSLGLHWVSCRQHIYSSCFCTHSASLCLLVAVFNSFTFKVIIYMYLPLAIILIIWVWLCRPFFFPSSFVLFSCVSSLGKFL